DAHFVNIAIGNSAVRARKIDIFEKTKRATFLFWKRLQTGHSLFVNYNNFTRLDVADKFGVNQIERAGLAGEHPGIADFADAQWAKTVRIAHTNEFALGHDDERVSAFESSDCANDSFAASVIVRLNQQV